MICILTYQNQFKDLGNRCYLKQTGQFVFFSPTTRQLITVSLQHCLSIFQPYNLQLSKLNTLRQVLFIPRDSFKNHELKFVVLMSFLDTQTFSFVLLDFFGILGSLIDYHDFSPPQNPTTKIRMTVVTLNAFVVLCLRICQLEVILIYERVT